MLAFGTPGERPHLWDNSFGDPDGTALTALPGSSRRTRRGGENPVDSSAHRPVDRGLHRLLSCGRAVSDTVVQRCWKREAVQGISQCLQITWELQTPWRPQSSGKVERMNQTLKRQLAKLCQGTHLKWPEILPIALVRIRITPGVEEKVSPFETVYGIADPTKLLNVTGD
ncbi:uncharacterized protein ACIBXB_007598 isoform 2-T5 [Morphnus guianensis]